MNNYEIADSFSLLAKLLEINGDAGFRAKSYYAAAFAIEKLPVQLSDTEPADIASFKGIGPSTAKKITELINTGSLQQLNDLVSSTPPGVTEMLLIKGIGPKKINTIWKEMHLEGIGELLYACEENRLKAFKGFGEKTQQTVKDSIEFYLRNKGNYLYAQLIGVAGEFNLLLEKIFFGKKIAITGSFARQLEVITHLDFVIEETAEAIENKLNAFETFELLNRESDHLLYKTTAAVNVRIYAATDSFCETLLRTSSSEEFFAALKEKAKPGFTATDEAAYFSGCSLPHIPAFLRESAAILNLRELPQSHLRHQSIRGLIHCHSDWSDGNNSIEEMAAAAAEKGMTYMVITDHSKTAAYAGGLTEDRIRAQHAQIDRLNINLAPFKIFKGIESDILSNGDLDYSHEILSSFEVVIASVHSNLKMTEDKAMARLLATIENPHTTIMGHLTGRLLLSRPGFPLDFKKIIDACAANEVVIELNANPKRLDMDWRYIGYALDRGVLISINPDAHSIKGIDDIKYGVISAQKAMLQPQQNLSSFSLPEFEQFIATRRIKKGI